MKNDELKKLAKIAVHLKPELNECTTVLQKDHIDFGRLVGQRIKEGYYPLGAPIVFSGKLFLALTKRKF